MADILKKIEDYKRLEIAAAKQLLDSGAISEDEFAALEAKAMA